MFNLKELETLKSDAIARRDTRAHLYYDQCIRDLPPWDRMSPTVKIVVLFFAVLWFVMPLLFIVFGDKNL